MTYLSAIAGDAVKSRVLLRFAGVSDQVGTFAGSYASRDVVAGIVSSSLSPGHVDYDAHCITESTASFDVVNVSFAPGSTLALLTADVTDSATSVEVSSVSSISVGDYLQIDQEAVLVSAITSLTLTVTRAQLGTTAQAHATGTAVADSPLTWVGRKCWVYLGVDDGGTWSYSLWRTMQIDSAPAFFIGRWSLSLTDWTAASATLAKGFAEFDPVSVLYDEDTLKLKAYIRSSAPVVGTYQEIFVACADGFADCYSASLSGNVLSLYGQGAKHGLWIGSLYSQHIDGYSDDGEHFVAIPKLRQVAGISSALGWRDDAASAALYLMLSDKGDGTASATYDALPGDGDSLRLGAGLTTSTVDVNSFLTAAPSSLPSAGLIVGVDGAETLADVLSKDIAPMLGGLWYHDRQGRIAFKRAGVVTVLDASTALGDNNTSGDDVQTYDDAQTVARVKIGADYDYKERSFDTLHDVNSLATQRLHGDNSRTVEIKSRMAASSYASALAVIDQYLRRFGYGVLTMTTTTPWLGSSIEPGDVVGYTNARLPVPQSSALCEVTQTRHDLDRGTVDLTLVQIEQVKLIAPALVVTHVNATDDVYVSQLYSDSTDCADEWAEGWTVHVYSATGTDRGTAIIDSANPGELIFTSGVVGISDGDVILLDDYPTTSSENNGDGYTPGDCAFVDVDDWG